MKIVYEHKDEEPILACAWCNLVFSFTYNDIKIFEYEAGAPYGLVEYYIDCQKCRRPLDVDQSLIKRLKDHG